MWSERSRMWRRTGPSRSGNQSVNQTLAMYVLVTTPNDCWRTVRQVSLHCEPSLVYGRLQVASLVIYHCSLLTPAQLVRGRGLKREGKGTKSLEPQYEYTGYLSPVPTDFDFGSVPDTRPPTIAMANDGGTRWHRSTAVDLPSSVRQVIPVHSIFLL